MLTANCTTPLVRKPMSSWAASCATASCASSVEAARCGVTTMLGKRVSGWSAGGAAGDLAADAAQADDAECLARQLHADEFAAVPLAALQAGARERDVPGQGHHHGDGVLGGRDGVAAGRVHDDDAAARGGGDVDGVHADAGPDDGPQLAGVFEQVGGDPGGAADDDAVGGAEGVLEDGAGQALAVVH